LRPDIPIGDGGRMSQTWKTENEFGAGTVVSWASLLDDNCRLQAEAISRVPIVEGHLALMPDAHFGFGPPVGSALRTRDAVMPYAVGVDIGCGMIAVRTDMERGRLRGHEGHVLGKIREYIPSGVAKAHEKPTPAAEAFFAEHGDPPGADLAPKGRQSIAAIGRMQFGTLGSGNHFVEVCEDAEGMTWLLLHSGSRGVGNTLATAHVKVAQEVCDTPIESREFAFVRRGVPQFDAYIADMLWCQRYAFEQREAMMDALCRAVEDEAGAFSELERINCHHNYAEELEPGLWLTRKGAIDATVGKPGIIPGSMGAATYIVRGKGCAEAYHTSPHGAGRLLGRNQARKELDLDAFKAQMVGRTWLDRDAEKLLDEAPSAYKPIETVIADSADLVEPVTVLSQFINYKGL
jgi:tRNA-splicing ligase RtcB